MLLLLPASVIAQEAASYPIRTPLPADTYITVGNLDWAWASRFSALNPASVPNDRINANAWALYPPELHDGWRYATAEELATRPPAAAFLIRPDLGPAGGVRNAAAYWNDSFFSVDFADADAGRVRSRPVAATDFEGAGFETWYVRDVPTTTRVIDSSEHSRADFNQDGLLDILWRHPETGQLAIYSMAEDKVRVVAGSADSTPADVNWDIVGTGDFNGDGKPDAVWRNKLYGFVGVVLLDGLNVLGVESFSIPRVEDIGWKIVAVGDINKDGKADLIWQHDTGMIAYWIMNGTTAVFGGLIVGDPGMSSDPGWRVVSMADMNGDQQMDLLWRHSNGLVAVWLMWGVDVFGVQLVEVPAEFVSRKWEIVATIDADRDGHQDIIWQFVGEDFLLAFGYKGVVAISFMDGLKRSTIRRTIIFSAWPDGAALIRPGVTPVEYLSGWRVVGPK